MADGRIRVRVALRGVLNATRELILRLSAIAKKYHADIEVHIVFRKGNVAWVENRWVSLMSAIWIALVLWALTG